jgi:membrane-associated phospholipid phosphatase
VDRYPSESADAAARFLYAAYFQLIVCATVFVLFPVRMPEDVITPISAGWATQFWRWFDGPNNCFPSLHAANGLLFMHFNWNRPARWLHTVAAGAVVVSTVLVKQHYAVDVVAGAFVYLLTRQFLSRLVLTPQHLPRRLRTRPLKVIPVPFARRRTRYQGKPWRPIGQDRRKLKSHQLAR